MNLRNGMILDEDTTQNLRKELKQLNEKNGEENDNLCHEWDRKQPQKKRLNGVVEKIQQRKK